MVAVVCERVEGVALVVLALVLPAALHTRRPHTVELHWVALAPQTYGTLLPALIIASSSQYRGPETVQVCRGDLTVCCCWGSYCAFCEKTAHSIRDG